MKDYKAEGVRITKKEIADYLGMSRQNLVNKLSRDTLSPEEIAKIAEKLNCEIILKRNDDGKEYYLKY